jgi:hypothetical protein
MLYHHHLRVCPLYSCFPSPKTNFRYLSLSLVSSSVRPWFVVLRLTPSIHLSILSFLYLNKIKVKIIRCSRFHVPVGASMRIRAFRDIALCSLIVVYRRFRGAYCLHLLSNESIPWWWRQHAPLKRRSSTTRLQGAISQKALTFNSMFISCIAVQWQLID